MTRVRSRGTIFKAPYVGLLLPLGLVFAVFFVTPFFNMIFLSFHAYSPVKIWLPKLTTANYINLTDRSFDTTLLRTLQIGLMCTLVSVLLSYPLAYFLARARRAIRALCLFLLLMPLMVSAVIRTYGWLVILGRDGLINSVLHALGFGRMNLLFNEAAVIIGLANLFIPFMTLPLMVSIERIDPRLEEAARNLGATWPGVFRRVILPLSGSGLVSGCLLVFTAAISAFVVPMLMGGPRIQMLGQRIYDEIVVSYQWPHASAVTTILALGTGLLITMALAMARHRRREDMVA